MQRGERKSRYHEDEDSTLPPRTGTTLRTSRHDRPRNMTTSSTTNRPNETTSHDNNDGVNDKGNAFLRRIKIHFGLGLGRTTKTNRSTKSTSSKPHRFAAKTTETSIQTQKATQAEKSNINVNPPYHSNPTKHVNVATKPKEVSQKLTPEQKHEWIWRIRGTKPWEIPSILESAPYHIQNNKKIVMAAVQKNGLALKYASPSLQNDKEVVMAAVKNNGYALEYASPSLQNDKEVVMAAVQNSYGYALKFASPSLQNDKEVVMAAIRNRWTALQFASLLLQNNEEIQYNSKKHVMAAVKKDGRSLQFATPELQNDLQVVLLAIQHDRSGTVLKYASPDLRNNKTVVTAAVNKDGTSLQYASFDCRKDKDVVKAAVRNDRQALEYAAPELQNGMELGRVYMYWEEKVKLNGLELQHAPHHLRNNKQIVMEAICSDPNAIKYASGNLKRDPDVLIAAGMFDERHHVDRSKFTSDTKNTTATKTLTMAAKKITMSTRFSLDQSSKSEATNFTKLLKDHEYIQDGNFKIYAPNAFDKKTCDPNWTDFDHPCRGTYDTCQFESKLKTGHPTDECCWRYSYRYHLQEAKDTGGFMIQLVESNTSVLKKEPPKLGNGQEIERDMAQSMNVKVFHVYRPTNDRFGGCEWYFDMSHVETVISAIKAWYDEGCQDMSECIVRP